MYRQEYPELSYSAIRLNNLNVDTSIKNTDESTYDHFLKKLNRNKLSIMYVLS